MHKRILRPVVSVFVIVALATACTVRRNYSYEKTLAEQTEQTPLSPSDNRTTEKRAASDLFSSSQPLGIQEAIAVAFQNNPDVNMAVARVRQSEAMLDEANAAFWPALSIYTEYMKGDAPSVYAFKGLDARKLPLNIDFNEPGDFQNFESGWSARYNLFRGGRDLLRKRMSETGVQISELDLQAVRNALAASVIRAYYTTLAARDFIDIAQKSVETVEAQLRTVTVWFEGGSVLKSEMLSLESRLAQARADLIRARNQYELSLAALCNVLGADPGARPELKAEEWQTPELPTDYDAGILLALSKRPELLKVRQQVVSSRMALDMERAEYLPVLDAQVKAYVDDEKMNYDVDRGNWTVGLFLNWDFFTGFSTGTKVDKAKAVLEEMLAADRKTTQSVQLDVKTAYLNRSEAEARLKVGRAGTAQAEEALRLVETEYEGGTATIVRYLDAELALKAARFEETSALYDLKKAQADLCRALGYFGESGAEQTKSE